MIFLRGRRALRRQSILVIFLQVLSVTPFAYANPRGGTVVHGSASISEAGGVMTINQATDRAIVNWQGFSNAAGESVRINQPGATSASLHRVTGHETSVSRTAASSP